MIKTLVEALIIVTVVIFLFLGSFRAVVVPVIAMPLSLIGTFFMMLVLGYSINLLTLLALVLAIGLVVDDAIIVVENVDRHMREGKSPMQASLLAARELGRPIIAMTVVLIAVYVPIGFQGGLTGSLFTEFAFTLAGSVVVSGMVALTLSPMMCSRFFKPEQDTGKFATFIEHTFERVHRRYQLILRGVLEDLAGDDRDGRHPRGAAVRDVQDVQVGTCARGGPGHRAVAGGGRPHGHHQPDADLCGPDLQGCARARPNTRSCSS